MKHLFTGSQKGPKTLWSKTKLKRARFIKTESSLNFQFQVAIYSLNLQFQFQVSISSLIYSFSFKSLLSFNFNLNQIHVRILVQIKVLRVCRGSSQCIYFFSFFLDIFAQIKDSDIVSKNGLSVFICKRNAEGIGAKITELEPFSLLRS